MAQLGHGVGASHRLALGRTGETVRSRHVRGLTASGREAHVEREPRASVRSLLAAGDRGCRGHGHGAALRRRVDGPADLAQQRDGQRGARAGARRGPPRRTDPHGSAPTGALSGRRDARCGHHDRRGRGADGSRLDPEGAHEREWLDREPRSGTGDPDREGDDCRRPPQRSPQVAQAEADRHGETPGPSPRSTDGSRNGPLTDRGVTPWPRAPRSR